MSSVLWVVVEMVPVAWGCPVGMSQVLFGVSNPPGTTVEVSAVFRCLHHLGFLDSPNAPPSMLGRKLPRFPQICQEKTLPGPS